MTSGELEAIEKAWHTDRVDTHWDGCHFVNWHHVCAIKKLVTEVKRLQAELAVQESIILSLGDKLLACSQVLSRAAETGRVCECKTYLESTYHG